MSVSSAFNIAPSGPIGQILQYPLTLTTATSPPYNLNTNPALYQFGSNSPTTLLSNVVLPQGVYECEIGLSISGTTVNQYVYGTQVYISYTNNVNGTLITQNETVLVGQLIYNAASITPTYIVNFIIRSPVGGYAPLIQLIATTSGTLPAMYVSADSGGYTMTTMVIAYNPTINFTRLS